MNKKLFAQCVFLMLLPFSLQAHAVKPFTVICGDGERIEVADSKYNPSMISVACLTAGHPAPLPAHKPPQWKSVLSLKKAGPTMAESVRPLLKLRPPQPAQIPPGRPPMPGQLSAGKKDDNNLISKCWSVQECNQMISDCYSVGGNFHPGIHDPKSGAVKEGYCRL